MTPQPATRAQATESPQANARVESQPEPRAPVPRPGTAPAREHETPAAEPKPSTAIPLVPDKMVKETCRKIGKRLASVEYDECYLLNLQQSGHYSVNGVPILVKSYDPIPGLGSLGRVLLTGGTHGDELTSVSVVIKWMSTLQRFHSGLFHWMAAPMVNPDGVLRKNATRTNARGVDVNRNLPTPGWEQRSVRYWERTGHDKRRYPGPSAASEPETRWLMELIDTFRPDVIVSVHAPLKLVDFDAPDRRIGPRKVGNLYRNLMGTYPGSLGNYAGVHRNIPVVTLELPHSWIMPSKAEISWVWTDLVKWLRKHVPAVRAQKLAQQSE